MVVLLNISLSFVLPFQACDGNVICTFLWFLMHSWDILELIAFLPLLSFSFTSKEHFSFKTLASGFVSALPLSVSVPWALLMDRIWDPSWTCCIECTKQTGDTMFISKFTGIRANQKKKSAITYKRCLAVSPSLYYKSAVYKERAMQLLLPHCDRQKTAVPCLCTGGRVSNGYCNYLNESAK